MKPPEDVIPACIACGRMLDACPYGKFVRCYRDELARAAVRCPEEYGYLLHPDTREPNTAHIAHVVNRMVRAIAHGTFSKHGRALRAVCRRLRIPYTYAAIRQHVGATRWCRLTDRQTGPQDITQTADTAAADRSIQRVRIARTRRRIRT